MFKSLSETMTRVNDSKYVVTSAAKSKSERTLVSTCNDILSLTRVFFRVVILTSLLDEILLVYLFVQMENWKSLKSVKSLRIKLLLHPKEVAVYKIWKLDFYVKSRGSKSCVSVSPIIKL